MPTANAEVSSNNADFSTFLTCAHIDHFNQGSRVTPALPSPTAVDYRKKGLSGGAIAGIVVGCVVGVALIALAALFLLNCCGVRDKMRRKKAPAMVETSKEHETPPEYKQEAIDASVTSPKDTIKSDADHHNVEVTGDGLNEMSPQSYKSNELPSPETARSELPGGNEKFEPSRFGRTELPGVEQKFELEDQQGPSTLR